MTRKDYNKLLLDAVTEQSQWFGIDTVKARRCQANWLRRLRREYPFSQFGVTWGVDV